jgi:hypothetical protein
MHAATRLVTRREEARLVFQALWGLGEAVHVFVVQLEDGRFDDRPRCKACRAKPRFWR